MVLARGRPNPIKLPEKAIAAAVEFFFEEQVQGLLVMDNWLLAAVGRFLRLLLRVGFRRELLATPFQFPFECSDPRIAFRQLPAQRRDLIQQLANLSSQFIHDPRSLPTNSIYGKIDLLNSYPRPANPLDHYQRIPGNYRGREGD